MPHELFLNRNLRSTFNVAVVAVVPTGFETTHL